MKNLRTALQGAIFGKLGKRQTIRSRRTRPFCCRMLRACANAANLAGMTPRALTELTIPQALVYGLHSGEAVSGNPDRKT
jgi:hypothetical protein